MKRHYYIIGDKVVSFPKPLSNAYKYTQLDDEQISFYNDYHPYIRSIDEVINKKLNPDGQTALEFLKGVKLNSFSRKSLVMRSTIVPDYQIGNAGLGIYDVPMNTYIRNVAIAFRDEYYRLKSEIESATTKDELNAITDNFNTLIEYWKNQQP